MVRVRVVVLVVLFWLVGRVANWLGRTAGNALGRRPEMGPLLALTRFGGGHAVRSVQTHMAEAVANKAVTNRAVVECISNGFAAEKKGRRNECGFLYSREGKKRVDDRCWRW